MVYQSGTTYLVPIDEWYVVKPPIWEDHRRARNWLAHIEEDPEAPGGFTRRGCERGRGRFKYSVVSLLEGDTIEFGADRIWADGKGRLRLRWVGEIVKITGTEMQVRYYENAEEMFAVIYDRDTRTREVAT